MAIAFIAFATHKVSCVFKSAASGAGITSVAGSSGGCEFSCQRHVRENVVAGLSSRCGPFRLFAIKQLYHSPEKHTKYNHRRRLSSASALWPGRGACELACCPPPDASQVLVRELQDACGTAKPGSKASTVLLALCNGRAATVVHSCLRASRIRAWQGAGVKAFAATHGSGGASRVADPLGPALRLYALMT